MLAYLGLGSNLGDRDANLRSALRSLADHLSLDAVSSIYETDPVGFLDQPPFLNMVARAHAPVHADARHILRLGAAIEAGLGRQRRFRDAPRTLDIDLLLLGDLRLREPGLAVPHPRMHQRAFVLVPLLEIDPALREPGTGTPYRDYLDRLDTGGVNLAAPAPDLPPPTLDNPPTGV